MPAPSWPILTPVLQSSSGVRYTRGNRGLDPQGPMSVETAAMLSPLHLLDVIDVLRRVTRDDHEIRRHARRNGADAVVFTQVDRAILGRDVDGLDGRE